MNFQHLLYNGCSSMAFSEKLHYNDLLINHWTPRHIYYNYYIILYIFLLHTWSLKIVWYIFGWYSCYHAGIFRSNLIIFSYSRQKNNFNLRKQVVVLLLLLFHLYNVYVSQYRVTKCLHVNRFLVLYYCDDVTNFFLWDEYQLIWIPSFIDVH